MKRVIIESPFRGDGQPESRPLSRAYLQLCILDCLRRDESPYASHQMLTEALNDDNDQQRARGIDAGYAWHSAADLIAFYIDRGWSSGMIRAKERCEREKLPTEVRVLLPPSPLQVYAMASKFAMNPDAMNPAAMNPAAMNPAADFASTPRDFRDMHLRGTPERPCEHCGQADGNTLTDGWYRCNACGYPGTR